MACVLEPSIETGNYIPDVTQTRPVVTRHSSREGDTD